MKKHDAMICAVAIPLAIMSDADSLSGSLIDFLLLDLNIDEEFSRFNCLRPHTGHLRCVIRDAIQDALDTKVEGTRKVSHGGDRVGVSTLHRIKIEYTETELKATWHVSLSGGALAGAQS